MKGNHCSADLDDKQASSDKVALDGGYDDLNQPCEQLPNSISLDLPHDNVIELI